MTQVRDRDLADRAIVTSELTRRSRIRGRVYCRETPFNSIRRHAEAGVCSISRTSPLERRRRVMNRIPRRLSSSSLAYVVSLESKISSSG